MFKSVYFGLVFASTLVGAVGLTQVRSTQGAVQIVNGVVGVAGVATAFTALGLGVAYNTKNQKFIQEQADSIKKIQSDLERNFSQQTNVKNGEINGLKLQINELASQIKVLEFDKETNQKQISELQTTLNLKTESYFKIILEKDLQIKSLETVVNARDARVEDFLAESKAKTIVFFQKRYKQLEALQATLSNGLESDKVSVENKELLSIRIEDIRKFKEELTKGIEEIRKKEINDFNSVLTYIFKFDNKFFTAKLHWKDVKINDFKEANKSLESQLQESIPKVEALARFRAASAETDERITALYEAQVTKNHDILTQLVEIMDAKDIVIADLSEQVNELSEQVQELEKPLQAIGTNEEAVIANRVSQVYWEQLGFRLDFINWTETETGYNITYAARQNKILLTNDELMRGHTKEQLARLTGCLPGTFPEFSYNYRNCTITLDIVKRKPPKKETSKTDVDKIWVKVENFEKNVRRWERVRITGGSQAGKSPTAKNLALAIMSQRKDRGSIKLYDPQGKNSNKDYWDMPKAGLTHDDSIEGLEDMCTDLKELSESGCTKEFNLYIFDEIDSTIAEGREGSASYYFFKDKVGYTLKQGSHQGVGCFIIGQSVDANVIPGMTWSDWNSTIQVHIGANAKLWLGKTDTLTSDQSGELLRQYVIVQNYCDAKNLEFGLDPFTDAGAYRFALSVPLSGTPKFIQLPDFDSYDYYEIMGDREESEETTTASEVQTLDNIAQALIEATDNTKSKLVCRHCESEKIYKSGKNRKGETLYSCHECDNTPKKFIPNINYQKIDQ